MSIASRQLSPIESETVWKSTQRSPTHFIHCCFIVSTEPLILFQIYYYVCYILLQVSVSNARKVTLLSVERSLSGLFQCEVSADAPLFHTDVKAAEMTVAGKLYNCMLTYLSPMFGVRRGYVSIKLFTTRIFCLRWPCLVC